jgi:uncharacterized membrane protein
MKTFLSKRSPRFYILLAMGILVATVSGVTLLFLTGLEAAAVYLGINSFPVGVVCGLLGAVLMYATWKGVFRLFAPRTRPLADGTKVLLGQ